MKTQIIIALISLLIGAILGYCISVSVYDYKFNNHVKIQTFDECFDYYAKNGGTAESVIKVCRDKANNTTK